MKILQINASYKPAYLYGGPTMSVAKLTEQLKAAGCSVEVFTTTANGQAELAVIPGKKIEVDGVEVTYFKRLTKDHSHFSPALLQALWKNAHQFDAIHIHAWWNLVSVLSAWIAFVRKVPVIVSPRGMLSAYSFGNRNSLPKKLIHNFLGRSLLNKAYLHTTSAAERQAMERILNPKKIFVIPNFVKLPQLLPTAEKTFSPKMKLLFLSRIEEKKGLDILLRALPMLTVPYHLTIAGDGNTEYIDRLKTISIDNQSADHISWIGFQQENKFAVLQNHDLFILPSYDENFGNAVIESLAMCTPVLISRQVGLADYVEQNHLGWLCDTNPASVSEAVNRIAENCKPDLKRINRDAPAIILRDFEEQHLTASYIAMYNDVIAHG